MKIIAEISNPHYHPDKNYQGALTHKRDLSVPPHWAANERIEKDGKSYAIIMPPREQELYEDMQPIHIHLPSHLYIEVNGIKIRAKVKVHPEEFQPRVHFDSVDGKVYEIESGVTEVEVL